MLASYCLGRSCLLNCKRETGLGGVGCVRKCVGLHVRARVHACVQKRHEGDGYVAPPWGPAAYVVIRTAEPEPREFRSPFPIAKLPPVPLPPAGAAAAWVFHFSWAPPVYHC